MKLRDLIVVCAVILIAGFAAADAIRGRARESRVPPVTSVGEQTGPTRNEGLPTQEGAPPGWPVGVLADTLVFTDARDCRARVVDMRSGAEQRVARLAGNCQLWVPPSGERLAYGLGSTSPDTFAPFRIADLAHPETELGGYLALFGVVIWSQDGRRVAWCGRRRTGFDLEVGGAARRLPHCPVAYTPAGRIAYAIENRLVVDGRTVVRAKGGITFAHFGIDGSLVIVEDGRRMVRYDPDGQLDASAPVPEGKTPILSPRNCAALFRPFHGVGRIQLVELPCYHGRPLEDVSGRDAAWSPDGTWIAVAERNAIAFHPVATSGPAHGLVQIRWPADATHLAWRAS